MASEILSLVAKTERECEEKIAEQREIAAKAYEMSRKKADEHYAEVMSRAKQSVEERLANAAEYAEVLRDEQRRRTAEEIDEMKKNCQSKESPVVLALSKKILELA